MPLTSVPLTPVPPTPVPPVPVPPAPATVPAVRRPWLIQGGMGVGVSGWRLTRAVSLEGQLGVVSGTALDVVLARVLQTGDPGGHARRALAAFPLPELARTALDCYFREGGLDAGAPMRTAPRLRATGGAQAEILTVLGNFAEVWLARRDTMASSASTTWRRSSWPPPPPCSARSWQASTTCSWARESPARSLPSPRGWRVTNAASPGSP
ncbi:hypothetical protein ACFWSF_29625 [Streptomyces sp. NPDC058611]|uniref:hypothetical protein n=1 Tax=unclassified Streptomyces TaxID=2593676 RepID=UPI0036650B79